MGLLESEMMDESPIDNVLKFVQDIKHMNIKHMKHSNMNLGLLAPAFQAEIVAISAQIIVHKRIYIVTDSQSAIKAVQRVEK